MGIGGISVWQLLIVLAIVIMLFGTKRLRSLGGDLGSAIKGFKKSMQDDDDTADADKDAGEDSQGSASLPRDESAPLKREHGHDSTRSDNATVGSDDGERKP